MKCVSVASDEQACAFQERLASTERPCVWTRCRDCGYVSGLGTSLTMQHDLSQESNLKVDQEN